MSLELDTAPAVEPVSTADAKTHLRVDHSDEDTYIDSLVATARREAERISWRQLITATWKLHLDHFPAGNCPIYLPKPPLQSVSAITYIDTNGDSQTWASSNYRVDANSTPARITPAYNVSYPSTRNITSAVTIEFISGYGADGSDVPANFLHWIKLWIGQAYRTRERVTDMPMNLIPNCDSLLDKFRDERILKYIQQ